MGKEEWLAYSLSLSELHPNEEDMNYLDTLNQFLKHHPNRDFNPNFVDKVKKSIELMMNTLQNQSNEIAKLKKQIKKENPKENP